MNYQRIYDQLVERAKDRVLEGYQERHHIVPRCLGGSDENNNLVGLTPDEHFFAHVLLVKIHPEHHGLIHAANNMGRGHKGRRTRKMYGWLKRRFAEVRSLQTSGDNNPAFGTRWIHSGKNFKKIGAGEILPLGWSLGRGPRILETKCKVCNALTGTKQGEFCKEHRPKKKTRHLRSFNVLKGTIFVTDGINDKRIPKTDRIPEGFAKGRTNGTRIAPVVQ